METNDFHRAYEAFASKRTPEFRVTDARSQHLSWPFFEPRHRELADELQRWCADNLDRPLRRGSRQRMPDAGARARRAPGSSSSASPTASTAPTCAASPSPARRSPTTARSPTSPSRCRGSARARSACSARSSRSANGSPGRERRGDRRLRDDRARMRLRRREHRDLGDARRQRMGAGRREDLYLQRRHRRFLRDLRPHRRRRRRARAFRLHRSGRGWSTVAERIE